MLTFGSICSGVGGADKGFEDAGWNLRWQCESDTSRRQLLAAKWPGIPCFDDLRTCNPEPVELVLGGDPCPKHSRAKSNGDSNHPDLAGYFLALAGRLRPRWLVRENVPAPTVAIFAVALEALGYGTVVIRTNAAPLTGQLRQRDFVVGCYQASRQFVRAVFSECSDGAGPYETRLGTRPFAPCLTTHRTRYDSRDCYVWHEGSGLRILDSEEREMLTGLPVGWTAGFSAATRAAMCGNAVCPPVAEWIAKRILAHA